MRFPAPVLADLGDVLAFGGRFLLLTDFDGTLAPLAADPARVELAPSTREDLQTLARSPRVRVGVLSGRSLSDVRARLGIPELIYAGCHGLEVEGPGIAFRHADAERQRTRLRAVGLELRARVGALIGVDVEDKGLAIALHYRNAAADAAERLEREAAGILRDSPGLTILRGKKVIEILPAVEWNKGECARWIRDAVFAATADVTTLCLGDDETDELAFDVLAPWAVTVRVGPDEVPSRAVHRLPEVADVQRLLSALATRARPA